MTHPLVRALPIAFLFACSSPSPSPGAGGSVSGATTLAPGAPCVGVDAAAEHPAPATGKTCSNETEPCIGGTFPSWSLVDFQPQSCRFGQSYGLSGFTGHVTVLALFAGW